MTRKITDSFRNKYRQAIPGMACSIETAFHAATGFGDATADALNELHRGGWRLSPFATTDGGVLAFGMRFLDSEGNPLVVSLDDEPMGVLAAMLQGNTGL